jgi:hypothetical protein
VPPWCIAELTVIKSPVCQTCEDPIGESPRSAFLRFAFVRPAGAFRPDWPRRTTSQSSAPPLPLTQRAQNRPGGPDKSNSIAESADGGPDALVGIGDHQLDAAQPAARERVRRKLAGVNDGNRQTVDILNAVRTDGLQAVEAACAVALGHGGSLCRYRAQHPGSSTSARSSGQHPDAGRADASACADRPIVPATTTFGGPYVGTNPNLRPHLVNSSFDLAGSGFIAQQRNLVLVGGTGTSKTHLAKRH